MELLTYSNGALMLDKHLQSCSAAYPETSTFRRRVLIE